MLCWSVQVDDDSISIVNMTCTKALVAGGEWRCGGISGQQRVVGMKKCLQETSMGENVLCTHAAPHAHQSSPIVYVHDMCNDIGVGVRQGRE